jgi:hypothetical protein
LLAPYAEVGAFAGWFDVSFNGSKENPTESKAGLYKLNAVFTHSLGKRLFLTLVAKFTYSTYSKEDVKQTRH